MVCLTSFLLNLCMYLHIGRERAFASSEFQHYNPRVDHHVANLVETISMAGQKDVDCSILMNSLSFDM